MADTFWIYDPSKIYQDYYVIIPTTSMSRIEQLNTITRFMIYFIIIILVFNGDDTYVLASLVIIITTIIIYHIYIADPTGFANDLIKENYDEMDTFNKYKKCNISNIKTKCDLANQIDTSLVNIYNDADKVKSDRIIESGYIDSDGIYKIGPEYTMNSDIYTNIDKDLQNTLYKDSEKKISWDKNNYYNKKKCRKPTVNNPYANITFNDYLDASNIAEPCNSDDDQLQKEMQNLYNSTIYRNVSDVFERENSQRIFYTPPIKSVPNDQTDFANWLYKTGPTCKENTQNCTYYEDPAMVSQRY